jgi:SWIM zinc finger
MPAPPARTIRLTHPPDTRGVGVFRITAAGRSHHYTFREIRCDIGGRGFVIHRLGLGPVFHVRVGRPVDCSCECLGFLYRSRCRHVLGLLALIRHGARSALSLGGTP